MLVNGNLAHAQLLQLLHQLVGQGPLPFGGGAGVVVLVGLGIYLHVRGEALDKFLFHRKSGSLECGKKRC
ncbi:hypothetical protein D3C81_1977770 [compost metagenome]